MCPRRRRLARRPSQRSLPVRHAPPARARGACVCSFCSAGRAGSGWFRTLSFLERHGAARLPGPQQESQQRACASSTARIGGARSPRSPIIGDAPPRCPFLPPRRPQQVQLAHHAAQVPGRVAGDAVRDGPARGGHEQAAGGHQLGLVRGEPLQHAPDAAGRGGEARRGGHRPGRLPLQHDRRVGRHLDGHGRHELQPAVARPDRRQHRDRHERAVV